MLIIIDGVIVRDNENSSDGYLLGNNVRIVVGIDVGIEDGKVEGVNDELSLGTLLDTLLGSPL